MGTTFFPQPRNLSPQRKNFLKVSAHNVGGAGGNVGGVGFPKDTAAVLFIINNNDKFFGIKVIKSFAA